MSDSGPGTWKLDCQEGIRTTSNWEFLILSLCNPPPQIPYRSYSDTPIAQLFIKPVGLAQTEKSASRQNYRLEVQIGQVQNIRLVLEFRVSYRDDD